MSEVDRALVFAILMENGRGIIDKAPSYMMEKWDSCKNRSHPETLLDSDNLKKFNNWHNTWLSRPPEEPKV